MKAGGRQNYQKKNQEKKTEMNLCELSYRVQRLHRNRTPKGIRDTKKNASQHIYIYICIYIYIQIYIIHKYTHFLSTKIKKMKKNTN
jgi:hypothetical protein